MKQKARTFKKIEESYHLVVMYIGLEVYIATKVALITEILDLKNILISVNQLIYPQRILTGSCVQR